ncbi:DUF1648 domain-containing protein [uncultured Corynebacterium sp.]|uniref:DUF1648 domain-containing protein n=1 Tax=uncultured Corynebacterium sp. TaxID=159447 RepID=UPI0025EDDE4D|nr:DUF1648 domain-containing protein [uncultured Corynebacterium sp.]
MPAGQLHATTEPYTREQRQQDAAAHPAVSVRWWFWPLVLLPPVLAAVALWAFFDDIPDPMPTHWGFSGEPDAWKPRSMGTLLFQLLPAPGICVFTLVLTSGFLWFQSSAIFERGGAKTRTDALRSWHEWAVMAPALGWFCTGLSVSLTVMMVGSYGPWGWLQGHSGWLMGAGMSGIIATTVWLLVVMTRRGRELEEKYPHSDGRRRKWGMFVEITQGPDRDKVMIDNGNGSNFTVNVATKTGRVIAVGTLVLLIGSGVLLAAVGIAAVV